MKLTVAICTWNRAGLLESTLAEMTKIRPPRSDWEVLVIDNNCVDRTKEVVTSFLQKLPIKYLFEKQQGLSHARNSAVAGASGDYVIWTDDDVLVDEDWLVAYEGAFDKFRSGSVFGGPIDPWFDGDPPEWLKLNWKRFSNAYAVKDLGSHEVALDDRHNIPFGANFAIRTCVQREHPYDARLGRSGAGGLLGEETSVIRAILSQGHHGWWVPAAKVRHWIPRERQSIEYLKNYFYAAGRTEALLSLSESAASKGLGTPAWLLRQWLGAETKALIKAVFGTQEDRLMTLLEAARLRGMVRKKDA